MNQTNLSNISVPDKYHTGQEPVMIGITIPETLLPGPKGEMQAGPRSIGFSLVSLLISVMIIVLLAFGLVWYLRKRAVMTDEQNDDTDDRNT